MLNSDFLHEGGDSSVCVSGSYLFVTSEGGTQLLWPQRHSRIFKRAIMFDSAHCHLPSPSSSTRIRSRSTQRAAPDCDIVAKHPMMHWDLKRLFPHTLTSWRRCSKTVDQVFRYQNSIRQVQKRWTIEWFSPVQVSRALNRKLDVYSCGFSKRRLRGRRCLFFTSRFVFLFGLFLRRFVSLPAWASREEEEECSYF